MSEERAGLIRRHPLAFAVAGVTTLGFTAAWFSGRYAGGPAEHASPVPTSTQSAIGTTAPASPGVKPPEVRPDIKYSCNKLTISRSGGNLMLTAVMSTGAHADTRALNYRVDYERHDDITGTAPNHDLSIQVPYATIFEVEASVAYTQGDVTFQAPCPTLRSPHLP
ncbi:MAG TPA: hypothetical protein VLI54_00325 [Bacillota bacterium]|nr:hypothetical protein [Bacillota bacterium]